MVKLRPAPAAVPHIQSRFHCGAAGDPASRVLKKVSTA
jgi:hypothetical protein